ncbi:major capsid protein, partial [Phocaeicola plebeius]|uniref:major capsid protein n=1 Tax=Phocaeicola plebeius TaxID=310297 RepID=UPI004025A09E
SYAAVSTASGLDDVGLGDAGFIGSHRLLRRGKRHDYFTSALPWPQKGPGVELPLNGDARVVRDGAVPFSLSDSTSTYHVGFACDGGRGQISKPLSPRDVVGTKVLACGTGSDLTAPLLGYWGGCKVDLSRVTAATINSLRQAKLHPQGTAQDNPNQM